MIGYEKIASVMQSGNISLNRFFYIVLICAHIALVWWLPYFPTQDGPSHLYNLAILHDLMHGGSQWGKYFTHQLSATPNLGFHLVAYPLLSIVSPLTTEKLFLTFYLLLMAFTVPLFIRTFAPDSDNSDGCKLLAMPVLFNFTLMMGFYSYVFAVPVFILSISLAWRLRCSSVFSRMTLATTAGVVIYFLHLIPFVFYLTALAVFAVSVCLESKDRVRTLLLRLLELIPLLGLLAFYLYSGTGSAVSHDFSYLLSINRLVDLFTGLFAFSTVYFSPLQILPAAVYQFVFLFLLYRSLRIYTGGQQQYASGQKALIIVAAVLALIYFAAPFGFGDGSYFNQRFPWVILLLLLPAMAGKAQSHIMARFGPVVVGLLFFFCNLFLFQQQSVQIVEYLRGVPVGCSKGDGILSYRQLQPGWPLVDPIMHAVSYYALFNGCVNLGNYETEFAYFPVRYKMVVDARPGLSSVYNNPDQIRFDDYPVVRQVIGWELSKEARKHLQMNFDRSFEQGNLTVWHRR